MLTPLSKTFEHLTLETLSRPARGGQSQLTQDWGHNAIHTNFSQNPLCHIKCTIIHTVGSNLVQVTYIHLENDKSNILELLLK